MSDQPIPDEDSIKADLNVRLDLLHAEGRCDYRREVRMLCWIEASRIRPTPLRIDYVGRLDGLLIGIEAKAPPRRAAILGRDLLQCVQYAHGIIAPATIERVPRAWVEQRLLAVFLASDARHSSRYVGQHGHEAHRLFGPANVGFLIRDGRADQGPNRFELFLCGERAWSPGWGWNRGILGRHHRVGNGVSSLGVDFSKISYPENADPWGQDNPPAS